MQQQTTGDPPGPETPRRYRMSTPTLLLKRRSTHYPSLTAPRWGYMKWNNNDNNEEGGASPIVTRQEEKETNQYNRRVSKARTVLAPCSRVPGLLFRVNVPDDVIGEAVDAVPGALGHFREALGFGLVFEGVAWEVDACRHERGQTCGPAYVRGDEGAVTNLTGARPLSPGC